MSRRVCYGIFPFLFSLFLGLESAFGRTLLDHYLLFPTQAKIQNSSGEQFYLPTQIEVWITHRRPMPTSKPSGKVYLLYFTGNAGRAEQGDHFSHFFPPNYDVEVWCMNYPGFGGSRGSPELSSIPKAALQTFDYMISIQKKESPSASVILSGFSLGTAAALYVASQRSADGLILLNPPALRQQIRQYGQHSNWMMNLLAQFGSWLAPKKLDSVKNASLVHAPALFFTSNQDELVPPEFQHLIIQNYQGPSHQVILQGATHATMGNQEQVIRVKKAVRNFLTHLSASKQKD
jgi:pimeloyl-ACP methyl ester carboxylesterase